MSLSVNANNLKEFDFMYITEPDYPNILAHLESSFYLEEPVNEMLGTSKDRVADQNRRYIDILKRYKKSIYVTAKTDSEIHEIAGTLIIHIHDINNPLPEFNPRSPITTNFLHFLGQIEAKYDVYEQHNLSTFPELAILSIDKGYRGKGLATELYRRAIAQLFSEGFPLIYTEFSNPISRKIGQNLGFKEVAQFHFNEYKSKDGSYLPAEACKNNFVSLMVLENEN